ncbi:MULTISPECIES: hypothetical protein [unclassified Massilia]|uniref:hypothetical protein n=1 Tax=unclassified Massilia TaxID=2609279 RepID=UPI00177D045F|nr:MULTISPECIES: hypothetical protein [unclassified Massilia]MBD8531526.1 hypothetical protein [Massilia sp. CFBP 13647]MBD8673678.1 hypothetical protein [Massilia sp. CFBP 13721]
MSSMLLEKVPLFRPEHIDRQAVRAFVGEYTEQLQAASARGDNVHQLALDQQDAVDAMTANWGEEDRLLFSRLYIEELNAYADTATDQANAMNAQATRINVQAAQDASNVATWISLIVFFGFVFFMIKLFKG